MRLSLLATALLAAGCPATSRAPDVPAWPAANDVESITATVFGSASGQPDLAEFVLPAEYVPAVVRVLSPPQYHKHPPAPYVKQVGRLRVTCRDGRTLDVRLIYYGKEPVLFTLQGVPCMRGGPYEDSAPGKGKYLDEVLTLEGFLRAIHSGDRARAREWLELLDKSAGRAGSNL